MTDDAPKDNEHIRLFELATGVEVIVHGDHSRTRLACRVIDDRPTVESKAVGLLDAFMRDRGAYDLYSIKVLTEKSDDGTDFSLRFTFVADRDADEYGYTWFEVFFGCHEPPSPPFWPHRLTVGFW